MELHDYLINSGLCPNRSRLIRIPYSYLIIIATYNDNISKYTYSSHNILYHEMKRKVSENMKYLSRFRISSSGFIRCVILKSLLPEDGGNMFLRNVG
jgi:hypothetical protein